MKSTVACLLMLPLLMAAQYSFAFERLECKFNALNTGGQYENRIDKIDGELTLNSNLVTSHIKESLSLFTHVSWKGDHWKLISPSLSHSYVLTSESQNILTLSGGKSGFAQLDGLVMASIIIPNGFTVDTYFGTCQAEPQIN